MGKNKNTFNNVKRSVRKAIDITWLLPLFCCFFSALTQTFTVKPKAVNETSIFGNFSIGQKYVTEYLQNFSKSFLVEVYTNIVKFRFPYKTLEPRLFQTIFLTAIKFETNFRNISNLYSSLFQKVAIGSMRLVLKLTMHRFFFPTPFILY